MIKIHLIDWVIICSYIFSLIYFGFIYQKNKSQTQKDFILSGRKLSLTGFVATLVTTWYGAILGIGENTYLYGIQTWFIFSLPYYFFALFYAIWISKKVRNAGYVSIPDQFRDHYGEKAGIISALILSFLSSPAPYTLSMGLLMQFLFGIELGLALMLSTFFSIIYIWNGGFSAIVRTDIFQFILMFAGFFLFLLFLWIKIDNPITMLNKLPNKYLDPLGGNSFQYVLVWFFIAAWTFIDPGFYQRCAAADSPTTARNGILYAIIFWAVFDFITIFCGLYAIGNLQINQATLVFPSLAINILPLGIFGIFITGILATIMSTIDSLSLVSAISFGRDILWRIQNKEKNPILFIKKGLIIISILSMLLSYLMPSIVQLLYTTGSILIPGLILPFLITLGKKRKIFDNKQAERWMVWPIIISIIWFTISKLSGSPLFDIEPFYPGMLVSFIYFFIYRLKENHGS